MSKQDGIRCATCRWCIREDRGWSNYSVEDTTWDCLLGVNPHFPADEFDNNRDSWEAGNAFGAQCEKHEIGDGIDLDVEHEDCNWNLKDTQPEYWLRVTADLAVREALAKWSDPG